MKYMPKPERIYSATERVQLSEAVHAKEQRNLQDALLLHLPEELLIVIIGHLLRDYRAPILEEPEEVHSYMWILPFLSVCRRIRSIALRATELWTTVSIGRAREKRGKPYSRLNWTQLCLDRAGINLLEVTVVLGDVDGQYRELMELAPRTKILHLERPEGMWLIGEVQTSYRAILALSWPGLRNLRLHVDWIPVRAAETKLLVTSSDVLTSLELAVVNGVNESDVLPHLNQLRRLQIGQWYHSSGESFDIPQLEDFHVLYSYLNEEIRVHDNLLPVFARLRNLCALDLGMIDFSNGERYEDMRHPDVYVGPVPALPHLRSLRLHGYRYQVSELLSILPDPTREMHLSMMEATEDKDVEKEYSARISARARAFLNPPPASSDVSAKEQCTCTVAFRASEVHKRIYTSSRNNFDLSSHVRPSESSDFVRRLSLTFHDGVNPENIVEGLQLANVVELRRCEDYEDFIAAIASRTTNAIRNLRFAQWDTFWTVNEDRISVVEDCLRQFVSKGSPLLILEVDVSYGLHDVEQKWLEEGLIGQVQYSRMYDG